jgi:hypothetical protein
VLTITMRPTDTLTEIDGVPVRLWEGETDAGTPCKVFVHRLAVPDDADQAEFMRELSVQVPPGRRVPLAMVL